MRSCYGCDHEVHLPARCGKRDPVGKGERCDCGSGNAVPGPENCQRCCAPKRVECGCFEDSGDRDWGWMFLDSDRAVGPFETREEALADAGDGIGEGYGRMVRVGRVSYPEAGDFLPQLDDVLDWMGESARDSGFYDDGDLFRTDRSGAEAFVQVLKSWAEKHVEPTSWTLTDCEEVLLGSEDSRD